MTTHIDEVQSDKVLVVLAEDAVLPYGQGVPLWERDRDWSTTSAET
jgi:hypothetical protein